jgi:hypothetical protein
VNRSKLNGKGYNTVTIVFPDEAGRVRGTHKCVVRWLGGRRLARARQCHLLRGAGFPAHQGMFLTT